MGYSPWGHKELDTTELPTHFQGSQMEKCLILYSLLVFAQTNPVPWKLHHHSPCFSWGLFASVMTVSPPATDRDATPGLYLGQVGARQTRAKGTAPGGRSPGFRCRNGGPGGLGRRLAGSPITKAALGQGSGGGRARRSRPGALTKLPLQLFSLSKYLTTAQRGRSSGGRVCVLGDQSWERGRGLK